MMQIEFKNTGISQIIKDYLAEKNILEPHYHRFPYKKNYPKQAKEKLEKYAHRETLCTALSKQMSGFNLSKKQRENLEKLKENKTVTVTTGHQLNLLTGPLYFIYKILHTIKICDELNAEKGDYTYVPIYWMATEDHDFQEINHFNTYNDTFAYDAPEGGFVGNILSQNTKQTLERFLETLPENNFGAELKDIVENAYFEQKDLASATRSLVNLLLGEYGILILDGNDPTLKQLMIPYFEEELTQMPSQKLIEKTNQSLANYKHQAHAREINLFYLHQGQRERIEKVKDQYILSESLTSFTKDALLETLHLHPERFSPNVILRPLYQEVILPNIAYVGGGGEIAYWLQTQSVFKHYEVSFPMLVLRNSMLLVPHAMKHKAETFDLLSAKMFEPKHQIKNEETQKNSPLFKEIEDLKQDLENKFVTLEEIAEKTAIDFMYMVRAQKKKQLKGYDKLHKRLLLSEKKKQKENMCKIDEIYDYFFPQENWQERVINFSEFYKTNGSALFQVIYDQMSPFNSTYHILYLDSILK